MLEKSNLLNREPNFCDFGYFPCQSDIARKLSSYRAALADTRNRMIFKAASSYMAWWGHNLQLKALAEERAGAEKRDTVSGLLSQSVKDAIYNNFLALLHFSLGFIAYGYLLLVVAVFFLQEEMAIPPAVLRIVESLSEPYLGAIGIYLFIKEIRSRRGAKSRILNEAFVGIWLIFFLAASILTFVSKHYHIDPLYNLIMTNSLASIIIRLGTVLHF